MSKTFEIFRREYVERVRKKSFVILTLVGPFLLIAMAAVPQLLIQASPDRVRRLAVVDLSGRRAASWKSLYRYRRPQAPDRMD